MTNPIEPDTRVDEPARLASLARLGVLDTTPEEPFENIVSLVRTVLNVPMAAVTLLDEQRQWFKARQGIISQEIPRENSFCAQAIVRGETLIVEDALHDPRYQDNPLVTGDAGLRSYLGIPLRGSDGHHLGALCAVDTVARTFTPAEIALLTSFARIVVSELELRRVAQFDAMTGALSRRAFLDRIEEEIERFQRYGCQATLVLFDIDHFKAVNDSHGHPAGDTVLRELVALLQRARRPSDIIGRLGGEEFAMLLPETDTAAGLEAAERFRGLIAENPVELDAQISIGVTASFGIAGLHPAIRAGAQWLACADVPLYEAKRAGRNQCRAVG